jgi:hypothetical protein
MLFEKGDQRVPEQQSQQSQQPQKLHLDDLDDIVESLYDFSPDELRHIAGECMRIATVPEHIEAWTTPREETE